MECAKCGFGLNPDDSNYCVNCGAPLREGHTMALYDKNTHKSISKEDLQAYKSWFEDHPVMPKTERFFCRKGSSFKSVIILLLWIVLIVLSFWLIIDWWSEVDIWNMLNIELFKRILFYVACCMAASSLYGIPVFLIWNDYYFKSNYSSVPLSYGGQLYFLTKKKYTKYGWLVDKNGNLLLPDGAQIEDKDVKAGDRYIWVKQYGHRYLYRVDGGKWWRE